MNTGSDNNHSGSDNNHSGSDNNHQGPGDNLKLPSDNFKLPGDNFKLQKPNDYVVYVLINTSHTKTYVGITNNIIRRGRQHNGELVGGAKYTTTNKSTGEWIFHGFIKHLNKHLALSFEKKIKLVSRKMIGPPIKRRMAGIEKVLSQYNSENMSNYYYEINSYSKPNPATNILVWLNCNFLFS
jgi:predicted GIY-YIG superfamily endonuclease